MSARERFACGSAIGLCHQCGIHCESNRVIHGTSRRRWTPADHSWHSKRREYRRNCTGHGYPFAEGIVRSLVLYVRGLAQYWSARHLLPVGTERRFIVRSKTISLWKQYLSSYSNHDNTTTWTGRKKIHYWCRCMLSPQDGTISLQSSTKFACNWNESFRFWCICWPRWRPVRGNNAYLNRSVEQNRLPTWMMQQSTYLCAIRQAGIECLRQMTCLAKPAVYQSCNSASRIKTEYSHEVELTSFRESAETIWFSQLAYMFSSF